ncbi:hypothetical protein Bca4012_065894 [Brassica carinata]
MDFRSLDQCLISASTKLKILDGDDPLTEVLISRIWEYYSKHKPEVILGIEAILKDEKFKTFLSEDIDEISEFKKSKLAKTDTLVPCIVSTMVTSTLNKVAVDSFLLSCLKTIDQLTSTIEVIINTRLRFTPCEEGTSYI